MEGIVHEGYFALVVIVALGVLLGRIRFKGFSFDLSAVIFAALLLGHYGFMVPEDFAKVGLLMFIYTVGVQSGPGFINAFLKEGKFLVMISMILIGSAMFISLLAYELMGLDKNLVIGMFTGALTSTPGLATAVEATGSNQTAIGYGISYPFGILMIAIVITSLEKMFHIDLNKEEKRYLNKMKREFPDLRSQSFLVKNEQVVNKTIQDLDIGKNTDAIVSQVQQGGQVFTPNAGIHLRLNDIVTLIGSEESLKLAGMLLGEPISYSPRLSNGYDLRWVVVTNKYVVNKQFRQLNLTQIYNANIIKIRRSGIEISPRAHTQLRYGDRLLISCNKHDMERVSAFLGDESKKLSEVDFLPFFSGILLGILLGQIRFSFLGLNIELGNAGGALIAGLLLSNLGKTGPILWAMSGNVTQVLRQLGLLFFLAAVGTQAGAEFIATIKDYGWIVVAAGILVSALPLFITGIIGYYGFRLNFITLLGTMTGTLTSSAGLGIIQEKSETNAGPVAYATVFPLALVLIITAVQFFVLLL